MSLKILLATLCIISVQMISGSNAAAQNELNVLQSGPSGSNWIHYRDSPNALYHHLTSEAFQLLEKRNETVSGLHTRADWEQRRQDIRQTLAEILGPFPEKTPLNPRIMNTIEKDFYKVEHIVFESQPGFYVTSSLFIPRQKQQPAPAIVYLSGHDASAYRTPVYQHTILNLVKKGFIVFALDPVSQGERVEYFDPNTQQSEVGSATREHSYSAVQAFLTGSSLARHMAWDGIRAIDYLFTRDEVDPERIGVTGRSGGGIQTAYLAAMDDRVLAAASEGYISNLKRRLQSIGPGDGEQNLHQGILRGIDATEYLAARAPKPVLIISTTEDFVSIQGARETFKEVKRMYHALGRPDHIKMVEDGGGHESTKKNREAMYGFFQKHLNLPGNSLDEEVTLLTDDEIRVTPTGRLATSLGGETIFSLNRKQAKRKLAGLQSARRNLDQNLPAAIQAAKELSGYKEPDEIGEPVFTGRIQRDGYVIEKYFIPGEGDYVIPYLLMIPDQSNDKNLLYLHPEGKAADAGEYGEIERLVKEGFTVLAPDLIGTGEMGPWELRRYTVNIRDFDESSFDTWFVSVMAGRSITGIRAGDAVRLARLMKQNDPSKPVYAAALGDMSTVLLHAAAFEPAIEQVALLRPYISYRSLVMNRFYDPGLHISAVSGALEKYDLPDLAAGLAPRKLIIDSPVDASGTCNDADGIREDLAVITASYKHRNAGQSLQITPCENNIAPYMDNIIPNRIDLNNRASP